MQKKENDYLFQNDNYWKKKLLRMLAENYKGTDYFYFLKDRITIMLDYSYTFKDLFLSFVMFFKNEFRLNTKVTFLSDLDITHEFLIKSYKNDNYLVEEKYRNYLESKGNNFKFFNDNKLLKNSIFSMMFKDFPYLAKEFDKIA